MHSCQSKCVLKKRAQGNSGPSGLVRWRCAGVFFLIYGRTAFRRRENLIFSRRRIGSEMELVSPFLSPAISEHPPAPCSAHQKSGTRIISFALSCTTLSSKMNRCRCIASELSLMNEKNHWQTAIRNVFTEMYRNESTSHNPCQIFLKKSRKKKFNLSDFPTE